NQPVYFGRSGTFPGAPRAIIKGVPVGTPGDCFDFAVGGLYCLNRPLLDMARRWLGDRRAFGRMCNITKEPEDVTVGFVVGITLGLDLNHTLLIHSHGDDLRSVQSDTLRFQIGISYGFGSIVWGNRPNVVSVPHSLFSLAEDPSR
ncbi:Beta-1,3-N-acetylglucosaminyltransferase radical fringe, partial [Geodia barretti]